MAEKVVRCYVKKKKKKIIGRETKTGIHTHTHKMERSKGLNGILQTKRKKKS